MAGDYSTNCTVGGVTFPVTLHVFNFTLSPEHHVTAEVNFSMSTIMNSYGVTGFGTEYWEYVEAWNQFLIDHRLTPRNPIWPGALVYGGGGPYIEYDCGTHQCQDLHDIWGFEIPASKYLDGHNFNDGTGFPHFRLNGFTNNDPSMDQRPIEFCGQSRSSFDWFEHDDPSTPFNQAWFTYITALRDYLDDRGYLSRANFCVSNEVTNTIHRDAVAWYTKHLNDAAPDLPLMVTAPPTPDFYNHEDYLEDGQIDIWLTSLSQHDPTLALDRLAYHGEKSWLFFQPFDLSPRFNPMTIDHPGMDSALLGWYLWRYRMSGFSHWSFNNWATNPWTSPAYQTNNGYLSLIYPPSLDNSSIPYGSNGHRPVPSVRLELLRDGLEDYEYLVAYNGGQAPEAGVASPIDEQVALLVADVSTYNRDDHFRANLRRLIGMVVGGELTALPEIMPQSSHPRAQGDPGDYYLNFQDPTGEPLDEPLVHNGHEYFKIGPADYDAVDGYGWYAEPIVNWQTAFISGGPNPLQSSILYSDWGRPAVFEFDLPSGNYDVTVSVGWEGRTYGHQQIVIEGVPFVADESVTDYLVRTEEVSVQDSRLTLSMGLRDEYTMLNYVDIEAVDDLSSLAPNTPPHQAAARLLPAWPNPCNPSTTVRFDLPRQGAVDLCVYDLAGHRVRTLIAGQVMERGRQETEWRGQDDRGRGGGRRHLLHPAEIRERGADAAGGCHQVRSAVEGRGGLIGLATVHRIFIVFIVFIVFIIILILILILIDFLDGDDIAPLIEGRDGRPALVAAGLAFGPGFALGGLLLLLLDFLATLLETEMIASQDGTFLRKQARTPPRAAAGVQIINPWADSSTLPAATATAATVATTATAAAATGALLGLVDTQGPATHVLAVQSTDHALESIVIDFHEAEATGTAGLTVVDQRHAVDGAILAKQFGDFILGRAEGQVAHVQFLHSLFSMCRLSG